MAIEKRDEQSATTAIITPAKADKVLEMIEAFEYFKRNALTPNDKAEIQGKPFVKKSGWSKYALACNVSTEVTEERVEERGGNRIYHFTYRAIHLPSGRYAEAVGSASEAEKERWNHPEHDIRTLAQTRAFNRSVSNLVGGGELSAEEMSSTYSREQMKEVKVEQTVKRARVGDPPRQDPPKPASEEPKDEPQGPPRSVEELTERIASVFPGWSELVVISDREDYYRIGRLKTLDREIEDHLDFIVSEMGGEFKKDSNEWRIPMEAEG